MGEINKGRVVQIVGAVVDIRFSKDSLPDLLNAVEIDNNGEKLVVEVAQHIGDEGFYYFCSSGLCSGGRSYRPGSCNYVCTSGRYNGIIQTNFIAWNLSGG